MKALTRVLSTLSLTAVIVGLPMLAGGVANAAAGVETGILTCRGVPGTQINLLIHSTQDIKCVFKSTSGNIVQHYKGETGIGLGIDLNWTTNKRFAFTVVSGSSNVDPKSFSLAGKYLGASAAVTLGVGGGLATLIGGGKTQIGLQPLAVSSAEGLGVSAGLGYLYLERDK